jgi:hypothetical protein
MLNKSTALAAKAKETIGKMIAFDAIGSTELVALK